MKIGQKIQSEMAVWCENAGQLTRLFFQEKKKKKVFSKKKKIKSLNQYPRRGDCSLVCLSGGHVLNIQKIEHIKAIPYKDLPFKSKTPG